MDDQLDLTEEEIDRLIAEVSGDDDVGEGDDFDIVAETEELCDALGSTSTDSVKVSAAELKEGDTIGIKKIADDGKTAKEDKKIAEEIKTKEEQHSTESVKDATTELKEGDTVGIEKIEDGGKIAKEDKQTTEEIKVKEEKHKTEATGAVSVPTEIVDKSCDDAKKQKDEIAVKENVAIATETADRSTEKKILASLEKDKKETSVASKDGDPVTTGKEKRADQHGKRTDNKKNEGKTGNLNKETLQGAKKGSAGSQSKGSPGKGMTGSEHRAGVAPPSASGKAVTKNEKGPEPATVGKGKAAGGKDAGAGRGSTREEKSPSGDDGKGEETVRPVVTSSVEGKICDRRVVGAESFPMPVQSARDDGEERVPLATGLSSDTIESLPEKVEELVGSISSAASSGGDLGTTLKKEMDEKPIVEKIDTNSGPKSSQENKSCVPLLTSDGRNAQIDPNAKIESRSGGAKSSGATGSTGGEAKSSGAIGSTGGEAKSSAATGSTGGEVRDMEAEAVDESSDQMKKSEYKSKEQKKGSSSQAQSSWFSGWGLSSITGAGKKAISTGIGVLENIGRKTMSVLTDEPEDDGVAPLSPSASPPSRSSSLRRKKKLDPKTSEISKTQMLRKCFDDCQGLAHFDALTDLSQVSQEKLTKQLERLSGDRLSAVKTDLGLIKDASDLGGMDWEENFGNTDHDFCQLTKDFISQLSLSSTNVQKLFAVQETTSKWLSSCLQENPQDHKYSAEDVHKMAILMFADFTATGIATFHKIAQLLLVDYSAPILSYKFRALSLAGLTKVLCTEIWIEARKFTDCLGQPQLTENSALIVSLMTNLTLEASNCSSCIQDGYHLLLPIIQLASLKVHPILSDCSEIANLEILQLMSSMSRSRVGRILNQLSSDARHDVQTELSAVEAAFHLSLLSHGNDTDKPCHDFKVIVTDCLCQAGVDINSQKLLRVQEQTRNWLLSYEKDQENSMPISPSDVNQMALKSLNELTCCSIELFHQISQILLMENPREISTYGPRASAIRNLTKLLSSEIECQSTKFADCILKISKQNEETVGSPLQMQESSSSSIASPIVTNIYLEASNSSTYIEDGFQLLLPIIQLALIKAHPTSAGLEG